MLRLIWSNLEWIKILTWLTWLTYYIWVPRDNVFDTALGAVKFLSLARFAIFLEPRWCQETTAKRGQQCCRPPPGSTMGHVIPRSGWKPHEPSWTSTSSVRCISNYCLREEVQWPLYVALVKDTFQRNLHRIGLNSCELPLNWSWIRQTLMVVLAITCV